ncbi:MAG TPA: hypothetical protein VII36_06415 [Usitatibacter sp.]
MAAAEMAAVEMTAVEMSATEMTAAEMTAAEMAAAMGPAATGLGLDIGGGYHTGSGQRRHQQGFDRFHVASLLSTLTG